MRLVIHRSQEQAKKWSSIRFIVSFKLEVSKEEVELIIRYDQSSRKLGSVADIWDGQEAISFSKEVKFGTESVLEALAVEEQVKKDCRNLKSYLDAANSYHGTEEVDF